MITVLSESEPVVRKEHNCDASDWILSAGIDGVGFSISEKRALVKARRNKWKISKGQKYIRQGNIQDGELYTFKAIPELHSICLKCNLYDT
tara:strand:- start:3658 stop:3930 length:273 start_codon:yes stop_codon:yes gene_type:complete